MVNAVQGLVPQRIPNKTSLKVHPAAVPYSIDFSAAAIAGTTQKVDLASGSSLKNTLGDVRCIYVDNSNNTASLSITMQITGQVLTWPAGYQGYLACAATTPQFAITTAGEVLVGFQFFNVELDSYIWSASPSSTVIGSILFAGSSGVDHSANAIAYPPSGYSKIATVNANTSRALIGVQNLSTDLVYVWRTSSSTPTLISLNGAAAATYGGGAWTSQTYKGAIEVWVPTANAATDEVSVYED